MLKIANALSMINMIATAKFHPNMMLGASVNSQDKKAEYLQFASKYNKNYTTKAALDDHQVVYESSDAYINRCNVKAITSGNAEAVHCGHNRFSDWTHEEFKQFVSGLSPIDESEMQDNSSEASGNGRRLNDIPTNVNHKKYMGPVKDQGACGSCAAFAATSTLEGSMAKKAGTAVEERISEQHLVDCTMDTDKTRELFGELPSYNNGCYGGWMHNHWEF